MVAQELWRVAALHGEEFPERMAYWQCKDHEIDFVRNRDEYIEVKHGRCSPLEFAWFPKILPGARLTIINTSRFETSFCRGITLEDFLLGR